MLEVTDLQVYYGLSHVLFGVCIRALPGEVVALLGRNGAGKTTTLKAVMGLVQPGAGRVLFRGEDLTGRPPHLICRKGIGFVPEDRRIFPDLTVRENLEVGRRPRSRGDPRHGVTRAFEIFPLLRGLADRRGGSLSGGEQQMLAVARTLVGEPAVLLLDEPSEGLAPRLVQNMADHVLRMKQEGLTVVLAEQNLHFAIRVSDRAYILEKGRIRYEGTMQELRSNAEVRRRYLMV
ncbi:MAG TPA: ABC transporter ATP-binding protein [Candidatus Methylomirabilis sp.]|nr:ABC transporter ATP-binding protein [Candidatus Methylomirabilis sp.]